MKKAMVIIPLILLFGDISFANVDIDIGGEVVAGWEWDSREIYPNNEFYLQRVRTQIEVEFDTLDRFKTEISFDLNIDGVELKSAELIWVYGRQFELGIGHRRKALGIEDLYNLHSAPSAYWSEVRELLDNAGYLDRDIGIWAMGKFFQEPYQIEYELGLFNGHGGGALTSEKQFCGRMTYSPTGFIDVIGSYGTGLDTLGLLWRDAWGIGAIIDPGNFEIGGEFLSGNEIISGAEFDGWHTWARYTIGKFMPYTHYETTSTEAHETNRVHLGIAFDPIEKIRFRMQTTFVGADENSPRSEIKLQIGARF